MKHSPMLFAVLLLTACGRQDGGRKPADLPSQPDRWLTTLTLQLDTKVEHVGKTSAVLSATSIKEVANVRKLTVGDTVDGVAIGAIRCTFFLHDASYGSEQFMWRGRWGCMAGRSRTEVAGAVKDDGTKLFDYIHLSPITL